MNSRVLDVLAGLATGVVIGVLFAPDKGSKTRKKIKNKSIKAKETLIEEFDGFLDVVSKKYESVVKNGEEILDKGRKDLAETINPKA